MGFDNLTGDMSWNDLQIECVVDSCSNVCDIQLDVELDKNLAIVASQTDFDTGYVPLVYSYDTVMPVALRSEPNLCSSLEANNVKKLVNAPCDISGACTLDGQKLKQYKPD